MECRLRILALDDVAVVTNLVVQETEYLRPGKPERAPEYYSITGQAQLTKDALSGFERGISVPFLIVVSSDEMLGRATLNGMARGALQSCSIG